MALIHKSYMLELLRSLSQRRGHHFQQFSAAAIPSRRRKIASCCHLAASIDALNSSL